MSPPSVDLIRRAYAAVNAGDLDFVDDHAVDDVVYTNAVGLPSAGVHRGREAVRRDLERQFEAWTDLSYEPIELRPCGDRVVALVEMRDRGTRSGAPVELRFGHVWRVRDGKVAALTAYLSFSDALEAVGLAD